MLSLDNSNERSPRLKSVGVDRSERDQSPKVRPSFPQLYSNNWALFRTETFSLATIFFNLLFKERKNGNINSRGVGRLRSCLLQPG